MNATYGASQIQGTQVVNGLGSLESTLGSHRRRARVAQLAEQGTLNPKVQGSIPCASTNILCLRLSAIYRLWSVCRDASLPRHLTASLTASAHSCGSDHVVLRDFSPFQPLASHPA